VNIFVNVMLVIIKSKVPKNVKLNVPVLILMRKPLRLVNVKKTGLSTMTRLVSNLTAYQIVQFMVLKLMLMLMEHVIVTSSTILTIQFSNVLLIVLNSIMIPKWLVLIILFLIVNVLKDMFTLKVNVKLFVI
jgi:hypothetical protein